MTQTDVDGGTLTVDPMWLTAEMERSGVARGATITEARFAGLIGTGQMGRNARFSLTWDVPDGRPASVVGKFPTDDPTARETAFANGAYGKEHLFYSELQSTVRVRAPRVFASFYDEQGLDFAFVMEDLDRSVQGDQFEGLTVDQAALAVEQAVGLHAPRWGDDALAELLTLPDGDPADVIHGYYSAMVEPAMARLTAHVDAECVQLVEDLLPLIRTWYIGSDTPATLTHMDFRPDNFLFAAGAGAPPLVVVDWQTMGYALAMNDVAYMIGGSFEPAERAEVERGLVEDYRSRLEAAGIPYAPDACWRDYRIGAVWGVVMSILATVMAEHTERGDRMLGTMLRRHAHHAIDVESVAVLRDLA